METVVAFSHGFILALGLILPLGVQNVFIFNQGACQAKLSRTLPVVMTAGICDSLLILVAVLGVSVAVLNFLWLRLLLVIGGVGFLAYMGWITWKSAADVEVASDSATWPVKRQVMFALSVSLLNPHAILDTIGVIGTSSLAYSGQALVAFTAACVLVSWLWFIGLALAGRLVRALDGSGAAMRLLNRVSAVIMWASGVYLLYSFSGAA
jgi:L-lysine exporter family protein LysE/ArgO